MSGLDDESLSLESLFTFVGGLSSRSDDDVEAAFETAPETTSEAMSEAASEAKLEAASGAASESASEAASKTTPEAACEADEVSERAEAVPDERGDASDEDAARKNPDLALLSLVVGVTTGIVPSRDETAPTEAPRAPQPEPALRPVQASPDASPTTAQPAFPETTRASSPLSAAASPSNGQAVSTRAKHASRDCPDRATRGMHAVGVAARSAQTEDPVREQPVLQPSANGASESIDAQLKELMQQRLEQIRRSSAEQDDTADPLPALAQASRPQEKGGGEGGKRDALIEERPKRVASGNDEPSRAPIDGGNGSHADVVEEETKRETGADAAEPMAAVCETVPDVLDSIMFDEAPSSIKAGMREADACHKRVLVLKATAIVATCAVGVAAASFALTALSVPDGSQTGSGETQSEESMEGERSPKEQEGAKEAAPEANESESGHERSGSVVYRYTVTGKGGERRSTTETVTFDADGLCDTSTIEVELADEEAAAAFLAELERDYGSSYREGSVQDATVRATVDVSANKLGREAYEDELRASVEDLVIVRKA